MFNKRGNKSWRGPKHWQRNDYEGESQQNEPNNPDAHVQFGRGNFHGPRGGKRGKDLRPPNGFDSGPSGPKFRKKIDNFGNNNFHNFPSNQNFHPNPGMQPNVQNQQSGPRPPNQMNERFPPQHDDVPFRCTMCGKPFKKEVLLNMHLETECKAVNRDEGPPNDYPMESSHPRGNFSGPQRGHPRKRGRGRGRGRGRDWFNPDFNPQDGNSGDNFNNPESSESWDEGFQNSNNDNNGNFRNMRGNNFSRGNFHPQNKFKGQNFMDQDEGGSLNQEFHDNQQNNIPSRPPRGHRGHRGRGSASNFRGDFRGGFHFTPASNAPSLMNHLSGPQHFAQLIVCEFCNVQCNTFDELRYHREQFHLKCKFCPEIFGTMKTLYLHQESHITGLNSSDNAAPNASPGQSEQNPNEPFNSQDPTAASNPSENSNKPKTSLEVCPLCSKKFKNLERLSLHLQNMHGKIRCPQCPYVEDMGTDNNHLTNHMATAHGQNQPTTSVDQNNEAPSTQSVNVLEPPVLYPCCLCLLVLNTIDELANHTNTNHQPSVVCNECGSVFKDEEQLLGHIKYEHGTNDFPEKERLAILAHTDYYPCEVCKEVQCNAIALQYHMRFHRVHTIQQGSKSNRQPYVACPECNVLIKSSGLKNHILTNHNTISCNVCQKSFSDKYVYVKHVDLEHYPNCVCNICCAICFNSNALQQHGATEHAMGELFKCNLCSKKFGLEMLVNVHELLHSELYSQCKVCGEFFKSSMMLEFRSHMIETHGMDGGMFV